MKKKIFGIMLIAIVMISLFLFNSDNENFTTKVIDYNGNNLRISVDGVSSDALPISGSYYLASYDCKSNNTKVTWDKNNYKLNISNGTKKGGAFCYLDFQTNPKLSSMKAGSYVKYVGNNGCTGKLCEGQNANFVSDTDMGYCNNEAKSRFTANGWRIGYSKNGSAYLIGAGSSECMCTNSAGTVSNSSCSGSLSSANLSKHMTNMDNIALKYCNKDYANGGTCSASNSWAMDSNDFQSMTNGPLGANSCHDNYSNANCGYTNDLIDNGGWYWLASSYGTTKIFYWSAFNRSLMSNPSDIIYGVRPVLQLDSSVVVTGGTGTYKDPYLIGNNTFWINDGAKTVNKASRSSINLKLVSVGAKQMCISTNTSVCTNYVAFEDSYTLDWSKEEAGEKLVYVYYKDDSGKVMATITRSITLLAS